VDDDWNPKPENGLLGAAGCAGNPVDTVALLFPKLEKGLTLAGAGDGAF
jgi:hypothetical protein